MIEGDSPLDEIGRFVQDFAKAQRVEIKLNTELRVKCLSCGELMRPGVTEQDDEDIEYLNQTFFCINAECTSVHGVTVQIGQTRVK
jgi:hypothetical protein